jgi:hypothetical protein
MVMLAFPVALSASLLVTALLLWLLGRWFPGSRMGPALVLGVAAGHFGWAASNEFSASSPESGVTENLRTTLSTFRSPREAVQWVVPILLLLSVATLLPALWRRGAVKGSDQPVEQGHWIRTILWAGIYSGTLLRLLWGSVYLTRRWSTLEAIATIAVHAIVLVAIQGMSRQPSNNRVRAWRFVLISVAGGAACGVIGMSGSAVYAQLLATGIACLLLCTVLAWWERASDQKIEWPIGMILFVVGTHLWLGHYYAELSLLDSSLLIGAMAAGSLFGACGVSLPAWLNRVLPAIVCLALSLAAIAHAGITLSRTLSNPGW